MLLPQIFYTTSFFSFTLMLNSLAFLFYRLYSDYMFLKLGLRTAKGFGDAVWFSNSFLGNCMKSHTREQCLYNRKLISVFKVRSIKFLRFFRTSSKLLVFQYYPTLFQKNSAFDLKEMNHLQILPENNLHIVKLEVKKVVDKSLKQYKKSACKHTLQNRMTCE